MKRLIYTPGGVMSEQPVMIAQMSIHPLDVGVILHIEPTSGPEVREAYEYLEDLGDAIVQHLDEHYEALGNRLRRTVNHESPLAANITTVSRGRIDDQYLAENK